MTRHLIRLVWNRKRQNLLLAFEIFLSYLVLFAVVFFAVMGLANWQYPLGFSIERLWGVDLEYPERGRPQQLLGVDEPGKLAEVQAARTRAADRLQQMFAALRALPNVEAVSASFATAYEGSEWGGGIGEPTRAYAMFNFVDDEFANILGLNVIAGRWFSKTDDTAAYLPVVINRRLARELYGDEDPLNRVLATANSRQPEARVVVGVIDEFRQQGELRAPGNYAFYRLPPGHRASAPLPTVLTIRVKPGTTAEFEETVVRTLQNLAPDWRFTPYDLQAKRQDALMRVLIPIGGLTIVSVFLLLMVALGLMGVVWQNVTRRFQEFGLRRANGATASDVRRQVLAELTILTSLAVLVGVALVVQLPVLSLLDPDINPPATVLVTSIVTSVAVIYLLTLLCGWYPSRLATQIHPAEALHYE
jgi:putative ABC transport system permease protein